MLVSYIFASDATKQNKLTTNIDQNRSKMTVDHSKLKHLDQVFDYATVDTGEHGVIQVRTLDWDTPLGTVAVAQH